jgi:hypothetical protein
MTVAGLRTSVKDALDTAMTTVIDVNEHGGAVNMDEVMRWARRSPAIFVAVLGVDEISNDGVTTGRVRIGAFVVTKGTSAILRDTDALNLSEAVMGHASNNLWAYGNAKAPKDVVGRNLYTSALDKQNIALWAVTWTQRADLSIPADTFDNLYTIHTDFENFPTDGVADYPTTVQPRGTYMSFYGHIYVSASAGTAIAASDTYQKLGGTTTLKLNDEFDMPVSGRLRHTGSVIRPCKVSASGSITVSSDAKVTVALAENGTVDANTEQEINATAAGGAFSLNLEGILNLDENDYAEVWVKADSTVTVTATKLNLVAAAT